MHTQAHASSHASGHGHSHGHSHGHGHHHGHEHPAVTGDWIKAHPLPRLPDIGRHESYYAEMIRRADCAGDAIAHESWKVGQYVTMGLDPALSWQRKAKCFDHAYRHHCHPPEVRDEHVPAFFASLANLLREHAGAEALRVASREDDRFALRLSGGEDRVAVRADARAYFDAMLPADDCPDWLGEEDYDQFLLIRSQWT